MNKKRQRGWGRGELLDSLLVFGFLGLSVVFSFTWKDGQFGPASLSAPAAVGLGVLAGLRFQMVGAIGAGTLLLLIFGLSAILPLEGTDRPPPIYVFSLAGVVAGFSSITALVVGYERRSVALRDQERSLLDKIFNALPVGVWLRARDGRSIFVNDRWADFTGCTAQQIMESSDSRGLIDLGPEWEAERQEILERNDSGVRYRSLELKDNRGSSRDLTLLSLGIYIDPLEEMGTLSLLIDETALRLYENKARRSERGLRLALDSALMGFWEESLETGQVLGDANWFGLLGLEPMQDIASLDIWEARLHPGDRERVHRAYEAFLEKGEGTMRIDYRIRHDSGRYLWVQECVCVTDRNAEGRPRQLMGTMQDISERKRTESDLEQARDRAESANAAKSQFIAVVSHEIRTPLNAILGMSQFLQECEEDDERKEMAEVIHASGERLLSLVNDILDFSKIEAGRLVLEADEFPVRLLFEDCVKLFRQSASQKSLHLNLKLAEDLPEFIVGDMERIRQVMQNLLSNAIKFTDAGEVSVTVGLTSLEALPEAIRPDTDKRIEYLDDAAYPYLHVTVKDTGVGIPHEFQGELFEAFNQVDLSSTRKQGGTGLGLAICKRLVQSMGGSIWMDSEAGDGATFGFVVRAGFADNPEASPSGEGEAPAGSFAQRHPCRMLIVGDHEQSARLLGYCRELGYAPHFTADDSLTESGFGKRAYQVIFVHLDAASDARELVGLIQRHEQLVMPEAIVGFAESEETVPLKLACEGGMHTVLYGDPGMPRIQQLLREVIPGD